MKKADLRFEEKKISNSAKILISQSIAKACKHKLFTKAYKINNCNVNVQTNLDHSLDFSINSNMNFFPTHILLTQKTRFWATLNGFILNGKAYSKSLFQFQCKVEISKVSTSCQKCKAGNAKTSNLIFDVGNIQLLPYLDVYICFVMRYISVS